MEFDIVVYRHLKSHSPSSDVTQFNRLEKRTDSGLFADYRTVPETE